MSKKLVTSAIIFSLIIPSQAFAFSYDMEKENIKKRERTIEMKKYKQSDDLGDPWAQIDYRRSSTDSSKRYQQKNWGTEISDSVLAQIENDISRKLGREVDIDTAYKLYKEFINPNRVLTRAEREGGILGFGPGGTLGVYQENFVSTKLEQKILCKKRVSECKAAFTNLFHALLAANALQASRNLSKSEKLKAISAGSFILYLYKNNPVNESTFLYGGMVDVAEQSIKDVEKSMSSYWSTVNFVSSLSQEEAFAMLVGTVGLGVAATAKYAQHICKDGGCSSSSSGGSNSSNSGSSKSDYRVLDDNRNSFSSSSIRIECLRTGKKLTVLYRKEYKNPFCHSAIIATCFSHESSSTLDEAARKSCEAEQIFN